MAYWGHISAIFIIHTLDLDSNVNFLSKKIMIPKITQVYVVLDPSVRTFLCFVHNQVWFQEIGVQNTFNGPYF